MNHIGWNDLFELLDDRSTSERRSELEGHLAECDRCRRLAESQRSFERRVSALPGFEPSRELTGRVLGMLRSSRRERTSLRMLAFLGAGIPLALVGALLAYAVVVGVVSPAEGGTDLFGGAFGDVSGTLEGIRSSLDSVLGTTGDSVARVASSHVLAIAALTVASVLVLVLADRLILNRLHRQGH